MDRIAFLLSTSSKSGRILEIGAGYNPVAPKAAGWRTHVVDHASQQELRVKFASASVDIAMIEAVDTIWRNGPLHEAIPLSLRGQFDTLIASHVLEHMPNPIGFLNSAQELLKPDGVIALALPDRRFCFDYFRPPPTTGDLLEAHAANRDRHSLRTAWNQKAYAVTVDGALAWGQHRIQAPAFMDGFVVAAATAATFDGRSDAPYVDYHAWTFTPASFSLAILELGQLGTIDWHLQELNGPQEFEFFALLRRGVQRIEDPALLQSRRMALLRQQLLEVKEQIAFGLADASESGPTDRVQFESVWPAIVEHDARIRSLENTRSRLRAAARPLRLVRRLLGLARP